MKSIISLSIFFLLAGPGWAQGVKEQLVVPLSEPGKPCKLEAHVLDGSIKVIGYEGKDVVIDVFGDSARRREEAGSGGMRRIGGGSGMEVSAHESNNTVTINSGLSTIAGLVIKVPQNLSSLKLGGVNHGEMSVSNVSGKLEINTVNGPITLKDISGSVVANTVSGSVVVTFKTVDPNAAMAFSTLSGQVDVTFPAELKSNVKLKTDQGGIFTDFDIAVDKTAPNVKKTESGHMYKIVVDEWVYGKINGGGPEMMMKTMTGNIYIRKAK
ncbi:MAG: DUF4097 family beta strand repeat protein [Bacteroidetes bacterium]|nr:DUF4097 family beta strand repeat protein [Bacteroidota bacterium]